MIRVRLGFGRMVYGMEPGLYAMGSPTPESPVLVTANYKLTVGIRACGTTDCAAQSPELHAGSQVACSAPFSCPGFPAALFG